MSLELHLQGLCHCLDMRRYASANYVNSSSACGYLRVAFVCGQHFIQPVWRRSALLLMEVAQHTLSFQQDFRSNRPTGTLPCAVAFAQDFQLAPAWVQQMLHRRKSAARKFRCSAVPVGARIWRTLVLEQGLVRPRLRYLAEFRSVYRLQPQSSFRSAHGISRPLTLSCRF